MTLTQADKTTVPFSTTEPVDGVAEEEDETPNTTIFPTLDEVLACQFSSWYPKFASLSQKYRGRSNVTIKSVILDLPEKFVDYLDSDQLILPSGTTTSSAILEHHRTTNSPDWSSDDDTSNDDEADVVTSDNDDDVDNEHPRQPQFSFPELDQAISHAIVSLGGEAVAPKLNWSSPRDAVWVNSGTLECRTAGDVYLLLKASDFCAHDVHHAVQDTVVVPDQQHQQPSHSSEELSGQQQQQHQQQEPWSNQISRPNLQLALRKWCTFYPSQEFRCFVSDRQLLAISQRHHSQHWPHLVERQQEFREVLQHFYDGAVRETLADDTSSPTAVLRRYVFDVYVDKKQRVWLIDINVWASRTDTLLFDWTELTQLANHSNSNMLEKLPWMRVVETANLVRADPLASYRAPIDTLHVASKAGGSDGELGIFRDFMSLCQRPSRPTGGSSSSDEDDEYE